MQFLLAGLIFGGGTLIAHKFYSNRLVVSVCMTLTTIIASVVAVWGNGSVSAQLWMFVVSLIMMGLGYYGTAKLLYGNDYWRQ